MSACLPTGSRRCHSTAPPTHLAAQAQLAASVLAFFQPEGQSLHCTAQLLRRGGGRGRGDILILQSPQASPVRPPCSGLPLPAADKLPPNMPRLRNLVTLDLSDNIFCEQLCCYRCQRASRQLRAPPSAELLVLTQLNNAPALSGTCVPADGVVADNAIPALWAAANTFPNLRKLNLRANFLWNDLPAVAPTAFAKVSLPGKQCTWGPALRCCSTAGPAFGCGLQCARLPDPLHTVGYLMLACARLTCTRTVPSAARESEAVIQHIGWLPAPQLDQRPGLQGTPVSGAVPRQCMHVWPGRNREAPDHPFQGAWHVCSHSSGGGARRSIAAVRSHQRHPRPCPQRPVDGHQRQKRHQTIAKEIE